jgi:hypothetical protein
MVNKNFRTLNHHYDGNSTYQNKAQNQTISSSNQQQLAAIRRQKNQTHRKTEKIKTHLTIIGVCTTTFPEKSGT